MRISTGRVANMRYHEHCDIARPSLSCDEGREREAEGDIAELASGICYLQNDVDDKKGAEFVSG